MNMLAWEVVLLAQERCR